MIRFKYALSFIQCYLIVLRMAEIKDDAPFLFFQEVIVIPYQ